MFLSLDRAPGGEENPRPREGAAYLARQNLGVEVPRRLCLASLQALPRFPRPRRARKAHVSTRRVRGFRLPASARPRADWKRLRRFFEMFPKRAASRTSSYRTSTRGMQA